ncbi:MAG: hypothetical protein M1834_001816 [Cirrosporium novae-zelandiae]|nr:MAG: hypothetical protein M1834_001816 [Cirrosporium novae-zelandiae]
MKLLQTILSTTLALVAFAVHAHAFALAIPIDMSSFTSPNKDINSTTISTTPSSTPFSTSTPTPDSNPNSPPNTTTTTTTPTPTLTYTRHCTGSGTDTTCFYYFGLSPWSQITIILSILGGLGLLFVTAWLVWCWRWGRKRAVAKGNMRGGDWYGTGSERGWERIKEGERVRGKRVQEMMIAPMPLSPRGPFGSVGKVVEGWEMQTLRGGSGARARAPEGRFKECI